MEDKTGNVYKPEQELTKWQSFRRAIWDSENREFCGRTGLSWFKITVFYIIFYACLAAFWTCMLVIFYQTISSDKPKWQLGHSRIGTSPGLGFRPFPPDKNVDSTLIWYNASNPKTVDHYVENLNEYLKPYREGNVGAKIKTCGENDTATEEQVCHFDLSTDTDNPCTETRKYGFPEGAPCILVKLNRIYGWKPERYSDSSVPKGLQDVLKEVDEPYNPDKVYITCQGENSADKDNTGTVKYHPKDASISKKFFPFYNQDAYVSPFVFVQFANINRGVLVNIECRAWADNIRFERADRLGSVHFELLVD